MLIVTRTNSGDKFRRVSDGPEIVVVDYTWDPYDYASGVKVTCYRAESARRAYRCLVRACEILDKPCPEFEHCRRFNFGDDGKIDYECPSLFRSWESGNVMYFYA